ncbi:type III-A CRISPR-associated RAMP protein Csm5 [Sulfurihydrogenibium sp.]|uniref:type III-A CRISPR-associated RAMP protein Csm5 n=1 Tax=Sulfurihydrogenibium sp. TaxID=2053621 RepID=UPI003D0F5B1E
MDCSLEILSPTHIGNGNKLNNWNYSYDEKQKILKVYDFDKVVQSLKDDKQRLSQLISSIKRNPHYQDLTNFLKQDIKPLYTLNVSGSLKRRGKDGNLEFKEVWEFIKVNSNPYIPGSEIKGAIRTAILYHMLKNNESLKQELLKGLKKLFEDLKKLQDETQREKEKKKLKSRAQKILEELENKVFSDGSKDGKKDFMRFISVSDTKPKNPEEALYVCDIKIINTSRSFFDPHELLKVGQKFEFRLDILWDDLYRNYIVKDFNFKSFKDIQAVCNEFANDLINHEIEFFSENVYGKEKVDIKKVVDFYKGLKEKSKNGFLLRLGKHQGFLSLTVNLIVKHSDENLFKSIYPLLVHRGYGNNPAKSRKLTFNDEPLGWVLVSY